MTARKASAKATANTGVSPLRFAPVEMTGLVVVEKQILRCAQDDNSYQRGNSYQDEFS
jgi:hypothetical protein